jgi:hypothetical protein
MAFSSRRRKAMGAAHGSISLTKHYCRPQD